MSAYAIGGDAMKGLRLTLLALLAFVTAACSRPSPVFEGKVVRAEPWSKDLVEQMASLPVQSNGRVKPLSVHAAFTLYKMHGRRDLKCSIQDAYGVQQKITLEPTEWLLDVWCYPDQAAGYPLFRIEHSGVMDALSLENDGQQLDFVYVSFDQVLAVAEKLQQLYQDYAQIDRKDRSTVEEHIVQLGQNVFAYARLLRQFSKFHWSVPIADTGLKELFATEDLDVGSIARHAKVFMGQLEKYGNEMQGAPDDLVAMAGFVDEFVSNDEGGVGIIAPSRVGGEQWLTLGQGLMQVLAPRMNLAQMSDEEVAQRTAAIVGMFTTMQDAIDATVPAEKEKFLRAFHEASITTGTAQYDMGQIELETYYYRKSWHYQSIHYFLFAFLLATLTWLMPRSKLLWWASMGISAVALGMLSYDLTLRCLITGHPPIKNLYDTFLFIAASGALLLLATEFVMPRRIALAAAPFTGALLVMFARIYEVENAADTMDPLVAVLDSNFWLATHVTTINIGYAAGLVAAVLANVWIFMRVFRFSHPNDVPAKALVRMTYGVTCFGLLFSVVGTILGGVWANDSWGRFWGWDPKENGALMICLGQIALLHARFSGWVRDFGFIVWSGAIGMVVVFSWFHVNLLGVGLHSYGFSSGLRDAVWISYTTQIGFLCVGALDVLFRPNPIQK